MAHSESSSEQSAADAVVRHHAQLAGTLTGYVNRLLDAAEQADLDAAWAVRDDLTTWLDGELLPHAHAEEHSLYRAAAAQPGGDRLIRGMLDEHRAILELFRQIVNAATPVRAAAAAYALDAMFRVHLGKENNLVLPMLVAAGDVSVATLLEGMHELIGGHGH